MKPAKLSVALAALAFSCSVMAADAPAAPAPDGTQAKAVTANSSDFDLVKEVQDREPTPDELRQIKKLWDDMRKVQEKPAGDQPKPVISMMNLDLSPGKTPPLVRISNQTGVILTFMDANGTKWPVERAVNLSDGEIEAEEKPAIENQNSVYAKAKKSGGFGNVAIFLKGFDVPVVITLLAGQKDVDYRVDFRVPAVIGGNSVSALPRQEFDDRLVPAIMGITPPGCKKAEVSDLSVMAWKCGNETVVRANGVLLSPATIDGKRVTGQGGINAWVVPSTPVVTMMYGGAEHYVKIGDAVSIGANQ